MLKGIKNMYVSVISSGQHLDLINDLLNDSIENMEFRIFNSESMPRTLVKRRLSSANAILIIVDDKFEENPQLVYSAKIASVIAKEDPQKIILTITLNNSKVPDFLKEWMYLNCENSLRKDIMRIRVNIRRTLMQSTNDQKKNNPKTKNSSIIALTIAMEVFAVVFIFFFFIDSPFSVNSNLHENETVIFVGVLSIISAFMTLLLSYFSIIKRRNKEDVNKEIESYSKRLKKAITPELSDKDTEQATEKNETDAIGRMMINLEDIKEFYTWSQTQAKAAFYLAMWMCIAGFVLILAAVVLPLIFNIGIQSSIIPALGGVITELIAGTALIVYKNSLSQLNHYHQALHEDERFLSSVNLVSKFNSAETQDLMLQEIVRSEIQMNLNNLLSKKENT